MGMKFSIYHLLAILLGAFFGVSARADSTIHYVAVGSGNPSYPYLAWNTAATNIQDAIDAAAEGDGILVTNGVYSWGGRVVYGSLTNRVVIDQAVTVQSVNGPGVTRILGNQQTNTILGDDAVRCVYMTNGATLIGFTLSGGATRLIGDEIEEKSGGGVWCEATAGIVVSNCIIQGNDAGHGGGGAYQGTLLNCLLAGNTLVSNSTIGGYCGGGAFQSALVKCIVTGNTNNGRLSGWGGGLGNCAATNCSIIGNICNSSSSEGGGAYGSALENTVVASNACIGYITYGGGVYGGTVADSAIFDNLCGGGNYLTEGDGGGACQSKLVNCTVVGNYAPYAGGGTYETTNLDCIIYYNLCLNSGGLANATNAYGGSFSYCCSPTKLTGVGNITNEPQLAGVFHLSTNSPCRAAGSTGSGNLENGGTDIDGEPWASPPSIGCDEVYPGSVSGAMSVSIGSAFTNFAPGYPANLQALITGPVTGSIWDFGDGTTVTNEAFVAHTWTNEGAYTVTLTAYNDSEPTRQIAALAVQVSVPAVYYVDLDSPYPAPPYASWSTAARNLQDAVEVATPGSMVWVNSGPTYTYNGSGFPSNNIGVYAGGGEMVYGWSNRLAITKPITVESVNGPQWTWIYGAKSRVRCVYLTNGAVLSGFTITNGSTGSGDAIEVESGGGVWCESTNALITNCIISGCQADIAGAGAYSGTFNRCTFSGNNAHSGNGGGAAQSVLIHCNLAGNQGNDGGGAYQSLLGGCHLAGNAGGSGGGAYGSVLNDCVVSNNTGAGVCSSVLNHSLLVGNLSGYGGGALGGALTNCTLVGNAAAYQGGGAYGGSWVGSGTFPLVLDHCLLSSNRANGGGGVCGQQSGLTNCILFGCTVTGNQATNYGGGAALAILNNCLVESNHAGIKPGFFSGFGGGIECGILNNCIVAGNSAFQGSGGDGNQFGSLNCVLNNCTIARNASSNEAAIYGAPGAARYCSLNNCIVYDNTLVSNNIALPSGVYNVTMFNCCVAPLAAANAGNITNDPLFVDPAAGDYHLQSNSPCLNSGDNIYVNLATDFDGHPRIIGGTVDMGAYEFQSPSSILSYAWAQQYGLLTDGSADYLDLDGSGTANWQKSIAGLNPTNSASVLAMWPPTATNTTGGVTVSWSSVNTRAYYLERATDLSAQPAFSAIQSNLVGQAVTTSYTDTSATNGGPYFYRVGVQ